MERVGVLVHPTRPVADAVEVLQRWTEDHGLGLVQISRGEQPSVAPPGDVSACDLIVALGGDGTVLRALHAAARTATPVLGVAYGSLGALTTLAHTQLRTGLDRFAADDWVARRLPALGLRTADGHVAWAINDVVLARRHGTQLLIDLYVDDELYVRLAGDGIIVATPLGSSAYSMAAGGSLLVAGVNGFLCTPLAMHGGCAPPLVVRHGQTVALAVRQGHGGFDVEVDGRCTEPEALWFTVDCEPAYATLVSLGDTRADLVQLRARGLITDSPRIVAEIARRPATTDRR